MASQREVAGLYASINVKVDAAIRALRDFRSRLSTATGNLKTMRDQAKITTNSISGSFKGMSDTGRLVGAALSAAIAIPMGLIAKSAVEMVAEYDTAMNVFKLITKASGDEMGLAKNAVEALAHDLVLPQFGKNDAAQALMELARGGLGAKDAVTALRPALLLAGAGEVTAKEGAELLANTLRSFKLPASEAGAVADKLAAVMKFAGVNFNELSDTVKIAGPAFVQAKVPLIDFLTLVGILAQNGIKGSESGTALRNMLLSLIAPTDEARALMQGLGIKVYDAHNNMRPLPDVLREMSLAFGKLSDAQQNTYARTIFGNSAFGEALLILKTLPAAHDAMRENLNKVGVAEDLAKAKTEGLSGAMLNAKKEVQNAGMASAEAAKGGIVELLNKTAQAALAFQKLPEPMKAATGAALVLGPAMLGLGEAVGGMGPAGEKAGEGLGFLGKLLEKTGEKIWDKLTWPILAAVGAFVSRVGLTGALAAAGEAIGGLVVAIGGITLGPILAVILVIGAIVAALVILYNYVPVVRDWIDGAFAAIGNAAGDMWQAIKTSVLNAMDWLGRLLDSFNPFKGLGINIGAIFGGGTPAARAGGGPVSEGSSYIVGERGPELFTPGRSGWIMPSGQGMALAGVGGGGGVSGGGGGLNGGNSRPVQVQLMLDRHVLADVMVDIDEHNSRRGRTG